MQGASSSGILHFDIACYGVSGSVVCPNPITATTNNPTADYKYVSSHTFTGGNYDSNYPQKVFDANTTFELMWTGTYWLVMGNPVVCSYMSSDSSYTVYANGLIEQWGKKTTSVDDGEKFYFSVIYTTSAVANFNIIRQNYTYYCLQSATTTSYFTIDRNESNLGCEWTVRGY